MQINNYKDWRQKRIYQIGFLTCEPLLTNYLIMIYFFIKI